MNTPIDNAVATSLASDLALEQLQPSPPPSYRVTEKSPLRSAGDAPLNLSRAAPGVAHPEAPTHVVGIGASAGGLEALEEFFAATPADTGMAFVVVQHLSPDFKSVMDELLSRHTPMPVLLVQDGVRVQANSVYLIPPRKEMIIAGRRLLLSDKDASQELNLPIDTFFRSLAQDLGCHAIGIVLSGAGSDGARGIRDIHDAGGIVLCQDEQSAGFDGMPRSARDTGVVDDVLPPAQMPTALLERTRAADVRLSDAIAQGSSGSHCGVSSAMRCLQDAYGIDFSHYKQSTVFRRIERRLQLTRSSSLEEYVERVASDSQELDELFHDLLIGVTRFFRDAEAFEKLETTVIPELLARASSGDEFRVWVAGCATGEEAYSLAILLLEQLTQRNDRRRLKILATDVHRGSLDFASRGLYDAERVSHVSPDLLERYFDKRGPNYQVSPELRQVVVFAPHNVVRDAPFTRIDFASCRNLLIYLQPLAQRKVLSLLHFALKRHGVLFLGPSENVGTLSDDFEILDGHWRIFRKHREVQLSRPTRVVPPQHRLFHGAHNDASSTSAAYSLTQVINVYDALLDEHVPPSLLVNERRELVHAFAGAGRYLKVRDGRPSLDLLDMIGQDFKMIVTGAMQRALKENETVTYSGLSLRVGQTEQPHRLTVKPVNAPGVPLKHILITIEQMDSPPPPPTGEPAEMQLSQLSRDQLGSLESELRRTKESLQATIEELETSNEELQAANEELLAANEELQSTNEELQSVNEELYTVNAEYQKKIAELTQLTNDMDNLLASIEVGTIFLDNELRIRKFTPMIAEAFHLLPQDIGRPIAGFSNNLRDPHLMESLNDVLRSGRSVEREISDHLDKWFFLRILPYRARGSVDGVVLTLIDINGLKLAEDAVFRERYLLNSLMDSVPDLIYFKDAKGRFVRVNRAMTKWLQLDSSSEATRKTAAELIASREALAFEQLDRQTLQGTEQPYRLEQHADRVGHNTWFMATRQPLRDRDNNIVGMLGVARNVTEQKRAEDEIRMAVKRRDEFLAMLSHELRNPLSAIVNAAVLLREACKLDATAIKAMTVIQGQSKQMTRLLDDLLEVSRITQNKIELRKQLLDWRATISDAVFALRERFQARGISVTSELPELPVQVEADPARLQQIVVNLLDNAAKYGRAGGRVLVRLSCEGEQSVLQIEDDGAGIEPAMLDTIFEPFVQGRATLHRTEGGMGLGLSVVRSLVEMHGGTIVAESAGLVHGSAFSVRLPIASGCASAQPSGRNNVAWPKGKRVVVIEDNADSCEMLELLLNQAGYEVFCAFDGKAGLSLIERERPDIGIVDIGLPEMDGFEVARRVRAQPFQKKPFLVALTGYGQESDRRRALEAGFDQHLVKPLDPEELIRLARGGAPS